jgi:hypothetical protein
LFFLSFVARTWKPRPPFGAADSTSWSGSAVWTAGTSRAPRRLSESPASATPGEAATVSTKRRFFGAGAVLLFGGGAFDLVWVFVAAAGAGAGAEAGAGAAAGAGGVPGAGSAAFARSIPPHRTSGRRLPIPRRTPDLYDALRREASVRGSSASGQKALIGSSNIWSTNP